MAPAEKMGPSGAAAERGADERSRPNRAESGSQSKQSERNADKANGRSDQPDRAATKGDGKQNGGDKQRAEDSSSATGKSAAEGKSTGEEGAAAGGASLTGEKRTQVQKAFSGHRSGAKVDVDIDVSVGVAVPRHVHLVAIPDDIIVIVPQWKRYKYIVVKDVICIVDPDTYEIVDVLVLA
jgi:hypothetical protein